MPAEKWIHYKTLIVFYRAKKIDRESFKELWAWLQEKDSRS